MREIVREYLVNLIHEVAAVDPELILLSVLIVCCIIVLDAITMRASQKRRQSGISQKTVSVDGSKSFPVKHYVSEIQGLAGRPDALIVEDGFIIPVERKPLARKIRDRYIAQLLVYMRLVEELEGKKPPYGYLILGPSCRRFKILNTTERQAWLSKMLDEMRLVLEGAAANPLPHPKKCRKCDMRSVCLFRADTAPITNKEAGPGSLNILKKDAETKDTKLAFDRKGP